MRIYRHAIGGGRLTMACAAALLMPHLAQAQASGAQAAQEVRTANTLEEVVVSARKREESLQDVPVAVSAFSAADMENNLVTDLNAVAELAPQVVIGRATSGTGAFLTIRGISSLSTDSGIDQSVAVSLDGVPMSRGRIVGAALFDMEQVEIMKGPQALFFGKNSPAGVISLRSANPSGQFEASVKAGYEFEADEQIYEGVISGPIAENFNARLALRYSEMKGWIKNVAEPIASPFLPGVTLPGALNGNTSPDGTDLGGRVTLTWTPSDDFDATLKLTMNKEELNSGNAFGELYCVGGVTVPVYQGVPVLGGADCSANKQKSESALPPELGRNYPNGNGGVPYMDSKFTFASLILNKRFENLSINSTTGYYDQSISDSYNADFTPYVQIFNAESEKYELITQELRLNTEWDSPINFMAGVYYEHADRQWSNAPDLFNIYNPVADNYTTNQQTSDGENEGYSIFAQIRWDITDSLELAAGARYSEDKKEVEYINVANNPNSPVGRGLYPQGQPFPVSYEDDNVSPEATLSWKPMEGQLLYVGYKTGYKAGGISNGALLQATATPARLLFGPEEVDGFEVGYKAELFERTLRFDVTAYRYDYEGLQVSFFDNQFFVYRVGNAAQATTKGVEGSFEWLATDDLSFSGGFGYNRAEFERFPNAQCYLGQTAALGCVNGVQDLSGKDLARAPDLGYYIGADYQLAFSGGWLADLSVNGAYTSSYQTQAENSPGGMQEDFWRLNAAVHLYPQSEKFRISAIGRNLTDSYYKVGSSVQAGANSPNQFLGWFNRPREVVLQAEYRFQ